MPLGQSPLVINCDFIIGSVFDRPGKRNVYAYGSSFVSETAGFTQSVGEGLPWSGGTVTLSEPTDCSLIHYTLDGPGSVVDSGNTITVNITSTVNAMKTGDVVFVLVSTGHLFFNDCAVVSITDTLGTAYGELGTRLQITSGSSNGITLQVMIGTLTQDLPAGSAYSYTVTYNHLVTQVQGLVLPAIVRGILATPSQLAEGLVNAPAGPTVYGGPPITTTDTEFVMSFLATALVNHTIDPYLRISTSGGPGGYFITAQFNGGDQSNFNSPAGTYAGSYQAQVAAAVQVAMKNVSFPIIPCCPPPEPKNFGRISGTNISTPTAVISFNPDVPIAVGDTLIFGMAVLQSLGQPQLAISSAIDSLGNTWQALCPPQWYLSPGGPGPGSTRMFTQYFYVQTAFPCPAGLNVFSLSLAMNQIIPSLWGVMFFTVKGLKNAAPQVTTIRNLAPDPLNPPLTQTGLPITTTVDTFFVSFLNSNPGSPVLPISAYQLGNAASAGGGGSFAAAAFFTPSGPGGSWIAPPGVYNASWSSLITGFADGVVVNAAFQLTQDDCAGGEGVVSQTLEALNFGFNIPVNVTEGQVAVGCDETFHFETPTTGIPILGVEVILTGSQTDLAPDAELIVQLQLPDGTLSDQKIVQLPLTTGTVTVGSGTDLWGLTGLTGLQLSDPNFQVNIEAQALGGELVTFTVTTIVVEVFVPPLGPNGTLANFNYLKSFEQSDGDLLTLTLGSDGVLYQEDVVNNPGQLTPFFNEIQYDNYAQSATIDNREFIAFSNLLEATDIPRTYTPPNLDRLSQVGPGAAPSATTTTETNPIVSITQPPQHDDPEAPGHLSGILWSAGPGSTAPGNILTVYYARVSAQPTADPDLKVGVGVSLIGVDVPGPNNNFNGQPVDGNYTVLAVGQGIPPGAEFTRWYFTVQMPTNQFVNQANHIEGNGPLGAYEVTTATMTTASQLPNTEVGSTVAISGTGGAPPAGYDGSYLVTDTPNAGQYAITATSLTGNLATYSYTIATGAAPAVGEQITVANTLNENELFNVVNATISSTAPGTFSLPLFHDDVLSAPEAGTGIIFGTLFKFEPGQVVGARAGGNVATEGIVGTGKRKVCYSFLTRNGFMTQPSPIFDFDVTVGTDSITIGNLLTGPPNVIARVIHFTPGNGGNFYNIPVPVEVVDQGITRIEDSTWIMDNTTTSVTLSFSDATLLSGEQIDIQGNNLFECYELGSSMALIPYALRLFAIGEQNKVFNFLNLSFDGGIGGGPGTTSAYPAGWTKVGAGGTVVTSPIFGWSYRIANASGSTQATYGMLTQPAFEDEFKVPIINVATTYSVRMTLMVSQGTPSAGNVIVDLYSPALGVALGTLAIPLAGLTNRMQIVSGPLLTTTLAPVPGDLELRIYAQGIEDGVTVDIDRLEPFPTELPVLDQQIIGSYTENYEAFDRLTGVVKCNQQNQQPVLSAFTLYGNLYPNKSGSILAVTDNNATEPAYWQQPRVVSNAVGTVGVNAVTTGIDEPNAGEEWSLTASLSGLYIFMGQQPVKLSEEIQSLWQTINWRHKETIWVKNDVENRRVLVGVPIRTLIPDAHGNLIQNPWIPADVLPAAADPDTPNVILMLNYKQLNTAGELLGAPGIHRTGRGRILAVDVVRKWAIWTIKAPAAAFITRADHTEPLFLGNSDHTGKIYELVDHFGEDDGAPFAQRYRTAGFTPTDEGEGHQIGVVRYVFEYLTMVIDGTGTLRITAHPNNPASPYSHPLLPDLELPATTNSDVELPLNEVGSRLYLTFGAQCIGALYNLSRVVMVMATDPWSPITGRNI